MTLITNLGRDGGAQIARIQAQLAALEVLRYARAGGTDISGRVSIQKSLRECFSVEKCYLNRGHGHVRCHVLALRPPQLAPCNTYVINLDTNGLGKRPLRSNGQNAQRGC